MNWIEKNISKNVPIIICGDYNSGPTNKAKPTSKEDLILDNNLVDEKYLENIDN